MLDWINGSPLDNEKELTKLGATKDFLWPPIHNLESAIDFKNSTNDSVQLVVIYKYLLEKTEKENKKLKDKISRKIKMQEDREYYTVQKNTIALDLSLSKGCDLSRVLSWFHYTSNLGTFTNTSGYPDNGGSHTLYIVDTKDNIKLVMEMLIEECPYKELAKKFGEYVIELVDNTNVGKHGVLSKFISNKNKGNDNVLC